MPQGPGGQLGKRSVTKSNRSRYVSGERGWIKTKNRDYWRYEMEREGAVKVRRERQFV